MLHLGAAEIGTVLPPSFQFFRDVGSMLVARLCSLPDIEQQREGADVAAPRDELQALAAAVPPFVGAEYLSAEVLATLWADALAAFRQQIAREKTTVEEFLRRRSPIWHLVGRVHFHLAERKDDPRRPFAFLATYTTRVGPATKLQHRPLGRAVAESADARDKQALLALLQPVQRAADQSPLVAAMLEDGAIFQTLAWSADEAWHFLQAIPACEAAGVVVRVPDWWRAKAPPRPQMTVTVGGKAPSTLGLDAMLDFDATLTLAGEPLTAREIEQLLAGADGLVRLRGQWVEIDRARLREVLQHWQEVERRAGRAGLTFLEGMRLLAGTPIGATASEPPLDAPRWSEVHAGAWLEATLAMLRDPHTTAASKPGKELAATLRPYQETGVEWLALLTRLGLGACLADDMGLGKTIQVLALLLRLQREGKGRPSLLVAPASLLANWQAEIERFAPGLVTFLAHPASTAPEVLARVKAADLAGTDLVLTTYGTVVRLPWLTKVPFDLAVLDEAQAIKNPGAKQTRAVKAVQARARIALTGTPIENRLGDLWSLFDFLNPGLLGSPAEFTKFAKSLERREPPDFGPLRRLVSPYILRRMKTDRSVIRDLPDKTEVKAFCNLTRTQAALYQDAVLALARQLDAKQGLDGIARRGVVLAFLLRFKQICNHPSHWLGEAAFDPAASGKFARLTEICESIGSRREKALVFTQFKEMTDPLAAHLASVFGQPGLVLHGATPLAERRRRVERFQTDDAVPWFVLSVKAGGTGLNLTAATHVIHFDRWWNPAVEDQATDRAYRIGQRRNVLVHKFVCRGTIEEKIDALIEGKRQLAGEILGADGGRMLTEMSNAELLEFVALDLVRATGDS